MSLIHEINCTCCEPKSEGASLILDKIHEILGGVPEPDKSVISSLEEVNALFTNIDLAEANMLRLSAGLDPYVADVPPSDPNALKDKIGKDGKPVSSKDLKGKDGKPVSSKDIADKDGKPVSSKDESKDSNTAKSSSSNSLDDVIGIAKSFLTFPVNEIPLDQIQMDDYSKKVGKFNVADLSDTPGLDVSKIMDFSKIDLSGIDSIKFSISTPTITVVKKLKIGPVSIGLKFIISTKEIAWFPVIGVDVSSATAMAIPSLPQSKPKNLSDLKKNIKAKQLAENEQALDGLKDLKSLQPVTASTKKPVKMTIDDPTNSNDVIDKIKNDPMSLEEAKELARKTYGSSPEAIKAFGSSKGILKAISDAKTKAALADILSKIPPKKLEVWKMVPLSLNDIKKLAIESYGSSKDAMKIIASSPTKEDLISTLSTNGVVLYQEVDIHKEMKALLDNEKLLEITPEYEDEDCGTPDVVPLPFNAEDVKAIQEECCSDEALAAKAAADAATPSPKVIDDILKDILKNNPPNGGMSDEEADKEVKDIQKFLDDVNSINDNMAQCAKEKQNALNNYWWYTEASYLNQLALEYTEARANMLDALNGSFASIEAARIDKINKNVSLKNQENELIKKTFIRLSANPNFNDTSVLSNTVLSIGPLDIKQSQLTRIEAELTFKQAVSSIRDAYTANEQEISKLSSQIENQKRNFKLPSLSDTELQNIKTYDLANESSILKIKTREFRKVFNLATSPITDQVGFEFRPISTNTITAVVNGATNTYTTIIGSPTPGENINLFIDSSIYNEAKALFSLNSADQGDMSDFIKKVDTRGKTFGEIWSKYYSPNRIDLLFTYKEQGYTTPKPQYDDKGNPIGPKTIIKIPNHLGKEESLEVAESVAKLDVIEDIALDFWENLESKTIAKMILLLNTWKKSSAYNNYVSAIRAAAENEARYSFSVNLIYQENSYSTRAFNSLTNSFSFDQSVLNNSLVVNANTNGLGMKFKNMYTMSYDSVRKFQNTIQDKIKSIQAFIELKKKCIADGEKAIEDTATGLSKKKGPSADIGKTGGFPDGSVPAAKGKTEKDGAADAADKAAANGGSPAAGSGGAGSGGAGGGNAAGAFPKDDCKKKLGIDPFGLKPLGNCPGPTKNCYWKEYTKKMQLVSVMPIPDIEQLYKRLFRYYPVAIQIPVPVPAPVVLPTLALGIPDPLISIPLPIVWKHIITITLPVGMFVIWIGLCGPIPGPYIMYIDEQMNPMFLVTPKGPIQIPANSLRTQDIENKSLIEMLKPLDVSFRLPMIAPFDKLLTGKKKIPGSFLKNDPDHPTTVIDKLQGKIKSSMDSIKASDLTLDFGPDTKEKLQRLKKAFDQFPPDIDIIQEGLTAIDKAVGKAVDGLKISDIKFPKDAKKLLKPTLGVEEFMEDIKKLLDTKIDLGLPIKMISLKKEIKKIFDRLLSDPEIKEAFKKINEDIEKLEAKLAIQVGANIDADKVTARVKELKKTAKAVAKKAADIITPEMLGFVASLSIPIPLPVPCYDNVTLPVVPPYITAILMAIKALPSLIDGIPDDALAKALKIDLSARLPRADDSMFFITEALLNFVPNLSFPDPASASIIKNAVMSTVQNFFKFKIRPPHPGAIQIVIPESLIKGLIKTAIKAALAAIIAIIIKELTEAIANDDVAKVLAVVAIIKAIFSTDIGNLNGDDIKAFLTSTLEVVDQKLEDVKKLLISIPKIDFKSLKETFYPPAILESLKKKPLKTFREGPFLEINTKLMLDVAKPILTVLEKLNIPFPVVLLGCALTPTRIVLSKVHPFSPKQVLPAWEMLSLKNIPWLIFLDQLVATAQRNGGLVSDYVIPYWLPDPPA